MTQLRTANLIYSTAFVEITYKECLNVIDIKRNEMFVLIIGDFADNKFGEYFLVLINLLNQFLNKLN